MARKCPNTQCPWRERYLGVCIAPIDERLRRNCPLADDDSTMDTREALAYIQERYPEQEDIWHEYLKRRETMKIPMLPEKAK